MIATLLIWKSGIFLRAGGYELKGRFSTVNGLLPGADVRYRGYKVGRVFSIKPSPDHIEVSFRVRQGTNIPKNSKLRVLFDGLIGEKYMGVIPNTNEKVFSKSGDILSGSSSLGLASFVDVGTQSLKHARDIAANLKTILNNEDVSKGLMNALLNLEQITEKLDTLVGEVTTVTKAAGFKEMMTSLTGITKSLQKATDTLFADEDLSNSIKQVAQNSIDISNDLKSFSGAVKTGLIDKGTFDNLDEIIKNLDSFSRKLNGFIPEAGKDGDAPVTGNSVIEKAVKAVSSLSRMELKGRYDTEFSSSENNMSFGLGLDLTSMLTGRYGLLFTQPGLGIDLIPFPNLMVSLDMYNLNKVELDIQARYIFWKKFGVLLGARRDAQQDELFKNIIVGFSYGL